MALENRNVTQITRPRSSANSISEAFPSQSRMCRENNLLNSRNTPSSFQTMNDSVVGGANRQPGTERYLQVRLEKKGEGERTIAEAVSPHDPIAETVAAHIRAPSSSRGLFYARSEACPQIQLQWLHLTQRYLLRTTSTAVNLKFGNFSSRATACSPLTFCV